MATWLTADTHFGHANIIRYCDRPFADVESMNRALTAAWNAIVAPSDTVFHLGDFAMGSRKRWAGYRAALNGRIVLVRGNHDGTAAEMRRIGFDDVVDNVVVTIGDLRCWLQHFPSEPDYQGREFVRAPAPASYDLALCGHVHDLWTVSNGVVNVGVDRWTYRPISVERAAAAHAEVRQ